MLMKLKILDHHSVGHFTNNIKKTFTYNKKRLTDFHLELSTPLQSLVKLVMERSPSFTSCSAFVLHRNFVVSYITYKLH